jgi:archaellum component FlaF (FlaF/FlaG flagellin family)
MRRRTQAFLALIAVCVLVGTVYVAFAIARGSETDNPVAGDAREASNALEDGGLTILFQHIARDDDYAHVAVAHGSGPRRVTSPLVCERVHFAADRGLCLLPRRSVLGNKFSATIFNRDFAVLGRVDLNGINSRARVSRDGKYGATTGFVVGHSYAADDFSTETTIIDMASGRKLANIEDFTVIRDGKQIKEIDFNFWGVTFARDSNRFYATLGTRGKTYLVEADVRARRMRVLHEGVECPSLSPDETRVAFKKRTTEREWRLHVLDLRTLKETELAEEQSVDDQVEWLDDGQILYGRDGAVWVVQADGRGEPRVFLPNALSPAVIAG